MPHRTYYRGSPLPLSDRGQRIGQRGFTDGTRVVFVAEHGAILVSGLDPATTRSSGGYMWDDAAVLYIGIDAYDESAVEVDANPTTFEVFDIGDGEFGRDGSGIFRCGERLELPVDSTPLSRDAIQVGAQLVFVKYETDLVFVDDMAERTVGPFVVGRAAVYFGAHALNLDPGSFELLGSFSGGHFVADARHVWFIGRHGMLEGLDIDRASVRVHGGYCFDAEVVLWGDTQLEGVEAATFRPLSPTFGVDAHTVFHMLSPVEELHVETVAHLSDGGWQIESGVQDSWCTGILMDAAGVWQTEYFDSDYSCGDGIEQLAGADPASFTMLRPEFGLATDKHGVWLGTERIAGPEHDLELFGDIWALDGVWRYARSTLHECQGLVAASDDLGCCVLDVVDEGELVVLGGGYVADNVSLWHRGELLDERPVEPSFLGSGFLRLGGRIVHYDQVMTSRKVVTFESCGGELVGASASDFDVLGDDYGTDGRTVFWSATRTPLDPPTTELLGGGWARDARHVCCYGEVVDAHVDSFRVLGGSRFNYYAGIDHGAYATDVRTVFRGTRPLSDAYGMSDAEIDAARFEVLNDAFGTDRRVVVDLAGETLLSVHAPSFEVIGGAWGRDRDRVVYLVKRYELVDVDVADPATLRALNDWYVADDRFVYSGGARTDIDSATIRVIDRFAIDASGVWDGANRIEGADPASFGRSDFAPGLMEDVARIYPPWGRPIQRGDDTRGLGNGAHWVTDGRLFSGAHLVAEVAADLRVIGPNVVRNDGVTYFEDVALSR